MNNKGKFITVEGIDGAGKSSFIPKIEEMLKAQGIEYIITREPGGTPLGETLREQILETPMDKVTELLLAFASRNEHIVNVINPALESGKWVLCDRFTDSTYAYQVSAKGVSPVYAEMLQQIVQKDLNPDLTLIFSVPTEVSKQRLSKTGKTPDKFESQSEEFFQKAIDGYDNQIKKEPHRCKLVDSSKNIEATAQQVTTYLNEFIEKNQIKKNKKNKP